MAKYADRIEELISQCFNIEQSLPSFSLQDSDFMTGEQKFRKDLYRIRCEINILRFKAENIDKAREITALFQVYIEEEEIIGEPFHKVFADKCEKEAWLTKVNTGNIFVVKEILE